MSNWLEQAKKTADKVVTEELAMSKEVVEEAVKVVVKEVTKEITSGEASKIILNNTGRAVKKGSSFLKDWFAQVGKAMGSNPHASEETTNKEGK